MSVTRVQTNDVAAALAAALGGVVGLRVYEYVADSFRPPGVVIGQPEIDYQDNSAPFCYAAWTFTLGVIASRSNDKDAQAQLSDFVSRIAVALAEADAPELFSVEPINAYPVPLNVAGAELPGYIIRVLVRA